MANWKRVIKRLKRTRSHDAEPAGSAPSFEQLEPRLMMSGDGLVVSTDTGSISGTKWLDLNADGIRQANEPGLEGFTITLSDGQTAVTTTDSNGNYTFSGLAAGTYTVYEELKSGWIQTVPTGTESLKYDWTQVLAASNGSSSTANTVATDQNGNVYMAGTFQGTVDFNAGSGTDTQTSSSSALYVTCLSSDGSTQWTQVITDSGSSDINDLHVDGDHLYVVGSHFLAQFELNGNLQWKQTYKDSTGYATLYSVTTDASGNLYVGGSYQGTVDFDRSDTGAAEFTSYHGYYTDGFLLKLGQGGSYQTNYTFGHNAAFVVARCVSLDADGNMFVSGTTWGNNADFDPSSGQDLYTGHGDYDIFLTRINADGTYAWSKFFGGSEYDLVYDMKVNATGDIYMTGGYSYYVDFDPGVNTVYEHSIHRRVGEAYVLKLNNDGEYQWVQTLDTQAGNAANIRSCGTSLALDSYGNVYVVGEVVPDMDPESSHNDANYLNPSQASLFIWELDSEGTTLVFQMIENLANKLDTYGSYVPNHWDVTVADNGDVFIVGQYAYRTDFNPGSGSDTKSASGDENAFVIKWNLITGRYDVSLQSGETVTDMNFGSTGIGDAAVVAPVVTDFSVSAVNEVTQGYTNDRSVSVSYDYVDEGGTIDGWMITETDAQPSVTDSGWLTTAPQGYQLSAGDGIKQVFVWMRDSDGNVSRLNSHSQTSIVLDTQAPAVTMLQDTTHLGSPELSGTVSDEEADVTVEIDGKTYNAVVTGKTWKIDAGVISPLSPSGGIGDYNVVVTAVDVAGNSTSLTQTLTEDLVSPKAETTLSDVTSAGDSTYDVTVQYTAQNGLNLNTLDTGDIILEGNGLSETAQSVEVVDTQNSNQDVTVKYTFAASGGAWTLSDDGTYTVRVAAGQVTDVNGKTVVTEILGQFTVAIPDVTPVASISDAAVVEGDSGTQTMTFTVTLDQAAVENVTIDYTTSDGTATAGQDYTSVTGSVSIAAGQTTAQISIVVMGDTTYEQDETFNVQLSNPVHATIDTSNGIGTGTIYNDDLSTQPPSEVFDGSTNNSFDLSNTSLTFVLSQNGQSYSVYQNAITALPVATDGATMLNAGDDTSSVVLLNGGHAITYYGQSYSSFYVGSNGSITFDQASNSPSATLAAQYALKRISPLLTDLDASGSNAKVSVQELDDRAVVTWENVPLYDAPDTSNTFQVEMFYDGTIRMTWLGVDATKAVVGLSDGQGTPNNYIESQFSSSLKYSVASVSDASITEGQAPNQLAFDVSLSEPQNRDVILSYQTVDGTATAGEDYATTIGTVTIPAGETSAVINIPVYNDNEIEPDQTMQLQITGAKNAVLANDTATGTIFTDQAPVAPVVDSFTVGNTNPGETVVTNNPTVAVDIVAHDDDDAIVGWMITESTDAPAANSADWMTSAPTSYTLSSEDGLKTLYAWTLDASGAVSAACVGSNQVMLDTTVSQITVDPLQTQELSPEITGTYGVDENVVSINVSIGGETHPATLNSDGTWSVAAGTFANLSPNHSYDVVALATDAAGNTGVDKTHFELQIDQTAPTLSNVALVDSTGKVDSNMLTNDQNTSLQLSFSEAVYGDLGDVIVTDPNGSAVGVTAVDGWGTNTLTVTLASLTTDGNYQVVLDTTNTITDAAGNALSSTSSTFNFSLDSTAPTITFNPVVTQSGSPALTGRVSEQVNSVELKIAGQIYTVNQLTQNSDGSYSWTLDAGQISPVLTAGSYDVGVTAVDAAGNTTSTTETSGISEDFVSPTLQNVVLVGAGDSSVSDSTPQFKLTFSEAVWDNQKDNLADFYLTNSKGQTIVPDSITWGDATVVVSFDTKLPSDGSYTLMLSASNQITDGAGNSLDADPTTPLLKFTVDSQTPSIQVYGLRTASTSPTIKGYVNDKNATVYVTLAGKTYQATLNGYYWSLNLADQNVVLNPGRYDVSVEAVDAAGNVGSDTTTAELSIYLLNGTFGDYGLDNWTVVDQVDGSTSNWTVDNYDQMVQTTEIGGASTDVAGTSKPGTMLIYKQGDDFTNYSVFISMAANDNGTQGIVFRYVDQNNFYRFDWSTNGDIELVKCADGVFTVLASGQKTFVLAQTYDIEVSAIGTDLTVNLVNNRDRSTPSSVHRTELLSASDSSFLSGSFGLYSYQNSRAFFGDLTVESQNGVNLPPVIESVTASSTSISDLNTADVTVVATDGNPNDELIYTWTVVSGSGQLVNADTATATYVPTDILTIENVVLQISVTDGIDTATDTVQLEVVDGSVVDLLKEDFSSGKLDNWTVVDQSNRGGGANWTISNGSLVQTTDAYNDATVYSVKKLGTFTYYNKGFWWDNYQVNVNVTTTDNDGNGVMFRMKDNNNYYRFSWSSEQSYAELVKCVDGQFTLLSKIDMSYHSGQQYLLSISIDQDQKITVSVDGNTLMQVTDDQDFIASGTIAMYTFGCHNTAFSNVYVKNLNDVNPAPVINSVTASSTNITDQETANLSVDATDQNDTNLTYLWTITSGDGTIQNSAQANAVYVPANLTSSETVTITVQVSDGVNTVEQSINLNVNNAADILLNEDFSSGTLNGWTNPTSKGNWSVQNGQLAQTSNDGTIADTTLAQLGTYLQYDNGDTWDNYDVYLKMMSKDNDYIGVMFRVVDANNYYRLSWNATKGLSLVKCLNGTFTELYSDSGFTYQEGQQYNLKISVVDNYIQIWIDDQYITGQYDLASPIYNGTIAMYSNINQGSYFDDIQVMKQ